MSIRKYEPLFPPIEFFITRFFVKNNLLYEQETKVPIPTMEVDETIVLFDADYKIIKRRFGFNEDAFITAYSIEAIQENETEG